MRPVQRTRREQARDRLTCERELVKAGWIRHGFTDRWHPPSCVAAWPFDQAWEMHLGDLAKKERSET